jgi:hypothetical protein
VNVARGEQPAAVLPFLQEGLAVHLGGRFQSSAGMQKELGRVLLRSEFVTLEEILSHDGFRALPADLSYAPSALFVEYLFARLGAESFLELYGALSGPFEAVASWSTELIEARLASFLAIAAEELDSSFREYWTARPEATIRSPRSGEIVSPQIRVQSGACELWIEAEGGVARAQLSASNADSLRCAFVWPQREPSLPPSQLFAEHFPGRVYAGERYALVLDPGEAGFYDYGLDRLVAKRADGFDPDPHFWDAEEVRMRFDLELDRLPDGLLDAEFLSR